MGRVVELVRGKDDVLRGARVILGKTGNIIGRPLNKLCHLELNAKFEDRHLVDTQPEIENRNSTDDVIHTTVLNFERSIFSDMLT